MNTIYNIDIYNLKKFYNLTDDQIKEHTINQLMKMQNDMLADKEKQAFEANKTDKEYKRIVKKYFEMFDFLSQYWSEDEIVAACAKHMKISDIIEEKAIPCERIKVPCETYHQDQNYEYLRTSPEIVPRYTKSGEQLLFGETKTCHVYRKAHQYQSVKHGNIVLELLYNKYPELREFEFKAYTHSYYDNRPYEIYPDKINCYTPFDAIMNKDIDSIIKRNEDYCKFYNHGEYNIESWERRVNTPEIQHYFNVIQNLQ